MKSNKKLLKIGSYSIGVSAVVLAVIIAFNFFVGQLPDSWIKLDTTAEGILTFGDETKKLLDGVKEEVSIYHIVQEGNENSYITELLARYASENSKITVTAVDPVKKPTFTSDYTTDKVSDNTVIVETEKRSTVINGDTFFMYQPTGFEGTLLTESEFSYYQQMYAQQGYSFTGTQYFLGEKKLSGAIDYVTAENLPVMYALKGHGETALSELYKEYTSDENVDLKELSLASGDETKVPEDAAAILIYAPTGDLIKEELDALTAYLDRGGNILLLTNAEYHKKETMPNMAALTEYMGLTAVEDIVLEGNSQNYTQYPYYLMPTLTTNGPAKLLDNTNIYIMSILSHGIKETGAENREVLPLLQTSDKAYLYRDETKTEDTFSVAYQSRQLDGEGKAGGTLIWFTTPFFLDDSFSQKTGYSNNLLYAATLQQLCEKPASISVIAKEMTSPTLTVSAFDSMLWHVVYIGIVPAAALIAGFAVWFRRRRR